MAEAVNRHWHVIKVGMQTHSLNEMLIRAESLRILDLRKSSSCRQRRHNRAKRAAEETKRLMHSNGELGDLLLVALAIAAEQQVSARAQRCERVGVAQVPLQSVLLGRGESGH